MDNQISKPKHKLRWYQFTLRTLLLVVLVAGIGFGALGQKFYQIRYQRRAVEELKKLGAGVSYADAEDKWVDRWLYKLFGEDYSPVVSLVVLSGSQVTDAGLVHLKGLNNLRWLILSDTQITDAGLEHLKGQTKLKRLELYRSQVTDVGLEHMEGLTNIEILNFYRIQITDDGLQHLKGLTKLKLLGLLETKVTDTGLEHLKGLTNLEHLGLRGTNVTEAGAKDLQTALPNCKIMR